MLSINLAFMLKIHTQMKMKELPTPDYCPLFFHLQSYSFVPFVPMERLSNVQNY